VCPTHNNAGGSGKFRRVKKVAWTPVLPTVWLAKSLLVPSPSKRFCSPKSFGRQELSAELRDRISVETVSDPQVAKRVTATGEIVRPGNAAEFAAEIDEQRGRIAEAAKAAGLAK
jgi:hypothetical protein